MFVNFFTNKNMEKCSQTDAAERMAGFDGQGPCGLDQRERLRRSGERPLWIDGPGFTGAILLPFFWGMVKKVRLLINKVTSNWERNWEVKRSLWITWQTCLSKQLMITPAARRGKHLKICPASMGDGGSFFPYFYHISFPYFYLGCCCFCFFDFWGTVWKVACYLGPGRFGAKGVSEIR